MSTDESLNELRRQIARKAHLDALLAQLYDQRKELEKRVLILRVAKREEEKDVARLEGRSLAAFFFTVVGQKTEKLDRERAEACAAAVKYDAAEKELSAVEEDIRRYKKESDALRRAPALYKRALEEKAEMLRASGMPEGEELLSLEEAVVQLSARKTELDEAIGVGAAARSLADEILAQLDDAEGMGVWDLMGGGLWTDMAKYSSLDDAQRKIESLQIQLRRFKTELADVETKAEISVEVDEFLRFADYFFDGLFADWAVLERIEQAGARMRETRGRIGDVLEVLRTRRTAAEAELAQAQKRRDEYITQAKM